MYPKLIQPISNFIERFRPAFFSQQEWVFHLVMAAVLLPVGNYINVGGRYLSDGTIFLLGTLWGTLSYAIVVVAITLLIRRIISRYPRVHQTIHRTVVVIVMVNAVALLYTFGQYSFFCSVPFFHKVFNWGDLKQMGILSVVFVTTLCVLANLLYAYNQWKREQTELESLKSETLQHQLDALKQQVNPHFLFNSLSSISSLVGENPVQAEQFVDDLAKVYRYMLQANSRSQVALSDELGFIQTYTHLLAVRYGKSLRIDLPTVPATFLGTLPALSLQVLIDNALKHNRMSPAQPLIIQLSIVGETGIRVTNTLQRKSRVMDMDRHGLAYLITRFRFLTDVPVCVQQDDDTFSVTLPVMQPIGEFTDLPKA